MAFGQQGFVQLYTDFGATEVFHMVPAIRKVEGPCVDESSCDYEKYTLQLVQAETVDRWRTRLTELAGQSKWPSQLPETREWRLNFPEKRRLEMLQEKAYEIPLATTAIEEEEPPADGSWW